ncbi:MAG TPA: alpha/beta hydrolase [Candidatus Saccharimonadia bacterium]|nr:alpha/beta hydrolase [Candidatus Saccharimonadia bacterium]
MANTTTNRPSARGSAASRRALGIAELRGLAQLATEAVVGASRIAEGVQQSIWATLGFADGGASQRTRGITGFVHRSIEGVARTAGRVVDATLASAESPSSRPRRAPDRIELLAALNGVIGDHLHDSGNPLAIAMQLRHRGTALDPAPGLAVPGATGRIVVLVHGLCLSESSWRARRAGDGVDHGEALAAAHDYTPIHVRYNTGRHVSQNGRALSALLERLVAHWPVPVERIAIVAHSMGGLVARSAAHVGAGRDARWLARLSHLACLGTPHQGAPLEHAGHGVDALLSSTRFSAPFAKLGRMRSAGITDLRHGHVRDEDWRGRDRFGRAAAARVPVPLPAGVACIAIAGATTSARGPIADRLLGDGLVPLRSALGEHDDPAHALRYAPDARLIVWRTGHMALLSSAEVGQHLVRLLRPDPAAVTPPRARRAPSRAGCTRRTPRR